MRPILKHLLIAGQVSGGGGIPAELATLRDGLVEVYALDEAGPGTRVGSVAGYNLTDVNNNMGSAASKTGARSLLGQTNKYLRRQTTDLQFTGNFTIIAWVNLDANIERDLFGRWVGGAEYLLWYSFATVWKLNWYVRDASPATRIVVSGDYSSHLRKWTMLTCEFKTSGAVTLQINQETPLETTFAASTPNNNASSTLTVGYAGQGYPNNDRTDWIAFYNRLLTSDEKAAHWNDGKGLQPPFTSYGDQSLNWILDGDSLSAGINAVPDYSKWSDQAALALGGYKYNDPTNVAVVGKTIEDMLADGAANVDTLFVSGKNNVVSIWAGTNDLAPATRAVALVEADYQAYCEDRQAAGFKVIAWTILPRNTGSHGGNQTTFNSDRAAFNTWLRANWSNFADALCDVAADTTIGTSNTAYTDATYYNGDQIHLTAAGMTIVAGIAATAIDSIT